MIPQQQGHVSEERTQRYLHKSAWVAESTGRSEVQEVVHKEGVLKAGVHTRSSTEALAGPEPLGDLQ